jgi:hypothetical protein
VQPGPSWRSYICLLGVASRQLAPRPSQIHFRLAHNVRLNRKFTPLSAFSRLLPGDPMLLWRERTAPLL